MIVQRLKINLKKTQIKALKKALINCDLATGPALDEFSESLKKKYNKKYCVLTSNGFSSLFISIKAMGWESLKIGIPAASTCFSIVNAVKASKNLPIFLDNNLKTANIDQEITIKAFKEKKIDCVISPTHFGNMINNEIFVKNKIPFLEDNAQSSIPLLNYPTCAETFIISFYPTKYINGIDGGAILTDNKNIYKFAKNMASYKNQNYYDCAVRYNFSMPNIHAVLGMESLKLVYNKSKELSSLRKRYDKVINKFENISIIRPNDLEGASSSKYLIYFNKMRHLKIFKNYMKKNNIEVSRELILLPNFKKENFPNAKLLVNKSISIPFYNGLKSKEINHILKYVKKLIF